MARENSGLTLQALEDLSGVSKQTISDIELGRNRNPGYVKVVKLARALGIGPGDLCPVDEEVA
jgi:transcriptional regulator with XRE-family HTH domain